MASREEQYRRLKGKQPLEILYQREKQQADRIYLRQMIDRQWREYSWGEVMDRSRRVATFLRRHCDAGDRIAIHAKNCADWFVADFAMMLAGMISVPLFPSQSRDSMAYVLAHSESKMIFVGGSDNNDHIRDAAKDLPKIAIHRCEIDCDYQIEKIIEENEPQAESPLYDPDQLFTLMYTSGTTGKPKGVMNVWSAVTFAVPNMVRGFGYNESDRFFSYLPLSHAAERILVELHSVYSGTPVHFPESLDTFLEDLQRTRPTMFFSVPRLWGKFKEGVDNKIPPPLQRVLLHIPGVNHWLRNKVQKNLGLDKARLLVTGASPISEDLQRWYHRMGIMLADGYGTTENFIYGCITHMGEKPVPGTVGRPFWDCEIKIADNGEILFKSDAIMRGYYLEPEKTTETLKDGYYHTGDRGFIDDDGLLHLTGRLSSSFKTSKGKFVQPSELEKKFGEETLLGQICVLGHGSDQPLMIANLSESGRALPRRKVTEKLRHLLDHVNDSLRPHERIKTLFITDEDWTPDNELVTPTLKIKRKAIEDRYAQWIEDAENKGPIVWESGDDAR